MKKRELLGLATVAYGGWELWRAIPSEIREQGCGVFCIVAPVVILSALYLANETLRVSGSGLLHKHFSNKRDRRAD